MKTVYFVLLILLLVHAGMVSAQSNEGNTIEKAKKYSFQSHLSFGLLEGSNGSAFLLQTINGYVYKSWYAGIGTGIDYYRYRSIPLFLDIRKELFRNVPFSIYADAGIHFPWIKNGESDWYNSKYKTSGYYDAGFSYGFPIKKSVLLISAGYSQKAITEKRSHSNPCLTGPCPEVTETYEYQLRRLSIKAGWKF